MADTDPNTFSALADVLGGAAKSGAGANQFRDALKVALENAKLNRDKYAATVPGTRLTTGLRASLASHASPSSVKWGGPGSGLRGEVPTYSGGAQSIFDAVKDPQTKALIDQIMSDTTLAQQRGGTHGGADSAMPTGIGDTSLMDKILGGGALTSGLLGALAKGGSGAGGSIDLGKLFGSILNRGNRGSADWQGPTQNGDQTIDPTTGMPFPDYGTGDPTQDPAWDWQGPQDPNEWQGPTQGSGGDDSTHFDDSGYW